MKSYQWDALMIKDKILVVEDDESILFNLKLSLEMNGFQVISASNGKIAYELLKDASTTSSLPNLILSDIMMPEMDGYELFNFVKSNNSLNQIAFIFISAKCYPDDIKSGKDFGVDDYITKPINEEVLLNTINRKLHKIKETIMK